MFATREDVVTMGGRMKKGKNLCLEKEEQCSCTHVHTQGEG